MQKETETHPRTTVTRRRWRHAFVATSLLLSLIGAVVLATPAMLTRTPLRNQMLSGTFSQYGLSTEMVEAEGGWLRPVAFQGLELRDPEGLVVCRIRELRTSRGLLGFLTSDADLGQLTLVEPSIEITVREDGSWPLVRSSGTMKALLEFAVQGGSLRINVPWREVPIVEITSIDLTGRIAREDAGQRFLTIDKFQVFDREPLSDKHAAQNLALIAPVLSQATRVTGEASVHFDAIRVPLDTVEDPDSSVPIRGRAEFHSVEAHLRQAWVRQLAQLSGHLTGTELPDRLQVVRDSVVEFSVSREGIVHQSMTFLLPEVASGVTIESSGILRLDESLDLTLTIQLPGVERAAAEEEADANARPALALLGQFLKEPIRLHVTGTVSEPKLGLPPGSSLLDELARKLDTADGAPVPPPITQAVFEIIRGASQAGSQDASEEDRDQARRDLPGGVLNLIRAIKTERERSGPRRPRR